MAVPPTVQPDRISFEVERLAAPVRGRLEVRGRWSGIRGRRFLRPALILIAADGSDRRVLAELADKPWAAEDGEAWRAAFLIDDVGAAAGLELSVAPDITVTLRGKRPRRPFAGRGTERRGVAAPRLGVARA